VRKSLIAILTVGALLTATALRAVDLWAWRAHTVATAEARAGNLAFILAEYIRESFAAGDASLRQIALYAQRIGGPNAPASEWDPILATASAGLAGVGSFTVTNASGIITHSTQPAIVGQSRRDQYVFKELAARPNNGFVISTPFRTVVGAHQFIIPIGRRLDKADGTFDGTVVATFTGAAPRTFFRTLDIGRHGAVWVFHPDGFVLFREPSDSNPLGETAAGNPIFDAAKAGGTSGALESSITSGGPVFFSAFQRTTTPPLVVAVSLDRNEVLEDFRHQIRMSFLFFALLTVLLTITLFILFRQMDAKAAAEHALRASQEAEARHLNDLNARLADALTHEQQARHEAEEANALKDEFLMTVSHELRTPLTAIHGWARMLLTGAIRDSQKQTALETIERNARAQTRLIDDLLDVSRVVGGSLHLEMREVGIADVVDHAVDSIRPAAESKTVTIETHVNNEAGNMVADPERLQQIVWNLLSNAVKFTPAGGRVQLQAARVGDEVHITVSDTGAGISAEFLPHVFERFRQQHVGTTREYGGLGLGLAIVRHLVALHGGSITAESDGEGRGATFRVRLPAGVASGSVAAAGRG
jgi:signal transduction histidine kinase